MSALFRNLIRFGRLLRHHQLDVPAGRMIDVARALEHVDIRRRLDFYHALRTLLVHRPQDRAIFDAAFRAFWRQRPDSPSRGFSRTRTFGQPRVVMTDEVPQSSSERSSADRAIAPRVGALSYSPTDVLRTKDFAQFSDEELERAKHVIATLTWRPPERRSRRRRPNLGREPDLRRLVRRAIRHGGEAVTIPRRGRMTKERPLVVIGDVSGSMERYARLLLQFVHGLAGGPRRIEAFVFATRFTRITRELVGGADVVTRVAARVTDWGGGTRIGDALREFNLRWARRVTAHGPVLLLVSDGWDRGDPDVLAQEMARLRRNCSRLIWLNPLLGSPGYQPLTRGMQAALPFVDDFLPAHNINSLEALASHLNRVHGSRFKVREPRTLKLEP